MLLGRHSVSVNAGGRSALLPWRAERACFPRQTRPSQTEGQSPSQGADRAGPPSRPVASSGRALHRMGVNPLGSVSGQFRWDGGLRRALLAEGQTALSQAEQVSARGR